MTTLQPGAVLGRYVLGEVLGRGGVGVVHAATHATLHTEHALKVLRVDDPEGRRRLLQEGRTQARLSHENVVAVRDALTLDDGRPVLVFDRVRGPSLRTLLRHASLPEQEIADIAARCAAAMTAAAAFRTHRAQASPEP